MKKLAIITYILLPIAIFTSLIFYFIDVRKNVEYYSVSDEYIILKDNNKFDMMYLVENQLTNGVSEYEHNYIFDGTYSYNRKTNQIVLLGTVNDQIIRLEGTVVSSLVIQLDGTDENGEPEQIGFCADFYATFWGIAVLSLFILIPATIYFIIEKVKLNKNKKSSPDNLDASPLVISESEINVINNTSTEDSNLDNKDN